MPSEIEPTERNLTNREMDLFAIALSYYKRYCDATPEVGMGPSIVMLIDDIACNSGCAPTDDERQELARRIGY